MFKAQNSVNALQPHKPIVFEQVLPAKITSVAEYDAYRRVDIVFEHGGTTLPLKMIENGISHRPHQGDWLLVGFVKGYKNEPYFLGYYSMYNLWTNHIIMRRDGEKEEILVQLPVLSGNKEADLKEYTVDKSKRDERAFVHLHTDFAELSYPVSPSERVFIRADKNGDLMISAPKHITINGENLTINIEKNIVVNTDKYTKNATNTVINSHFVVNGVSIINGTTTINGTTAIVGTFNVTGATTINGATNITGSSINLVGNSDSLSL